ncbi:CBS domain-containing protein [Peribacillus sp. SCS-37]|uniref:CBS domain-containing protein n=1 Tax=Paraperibacillus esterisolvens TaxID=3115296 RepID=UPI003906C37F
MKTVREYMTSDVTFCTTLDNVYEAALKMKDNDVGIIPVLEDDELAGVLTDRDLVVRGIAGKHPGSTKVTDIMTREIYTAAPDMSIEEALELMASRQVKRLPVVDDGRLAGIIALKDIAVHQDTIAEAGHTLSEISEGHGNNFN